MNLRSNLFTLVTAVGMASVACYNIPPPTEMPDDNRMERRTRRQDPAPEDPAPNNNQDPQDPMNPDPDPMTPDPDPEPDPNNPDPTPDPNNPDPEPDPMNPDPTPTPDPNDPLAAARAMFDADVAPVLQTQCAIEACHGGVGTSPLKFLPGTMAEYYVVVTSYEDRVVGYFDKTVAPMLNRIVPGPHYTAMFTDVEAQKVAAWLDAELAARSAGTPTPPQGGGTPQPTPGQVSAQLIAEWSGCMNLADWNQENVAEAWAYLGSGEGPCIRCHINGQASFIATDESERMFNILTTNRYFMLSYFVPNVTDLTNAKMEINTTSFQRVGDSLYPHLQHPNFDENGDAMDALIRFYNATVARKTAGTCDPPRIVSP
jgi:hypothetical protein